VALVGLAGTSALAQERGITVTGTGVVESMPDALELTATVEGNAELAGDALTKYRGNKQRFLAAIEKLNAKGMAVAGSGLSVNSGSTPNMMQALQGGGDQQKAADKVAFQEHLTVTLSGVDAMSPDDVLQSVTRLIDVAKDAGVTIGPGPRSMMEIQFAGGKPTALARFKLTKPEGPRQQAYQAALEQARAKAQGLAKLAGVELGEVVSIRETVPVAKDDGSGGGLASYVALFAGAASAQPEYTATELRKIPVSVSLSVQFAIGGKK
jgi:uncharacterized protein YggE